MRWEERAYHGNSLALVLLRRAHLELLLIGFRLCRSLSWILIVHRLARGVVWLWSWIIVMVIHERKSSPSSNSKQGRLTLTVTRNRGTAGASPTLSIALFSTITPCGLSLSIPSAHCTGQAPSDGPRRRSWRRAIPIPLRWGVQTGNRLAQPPCPSPSPQEFLYECHHFVFKHGDKRERAPHFVQLVLRDLVKPGSRVVKLELAGSGHRPNVIIHRLRWVDAHTEILEVRPPLYKHTGRIRLPVVENDATVLTVWMGSECRSTQEPFFVQAVVVDGLVGFVPRRVRLPGVPRACIDETIATWLRVRRVLKLWGRLVHQGGGGVME
jgi:hypothetical protein